ncbi:hypothetical protein [Ileibacterium valens]|uniref:hypothetical protein n=1 Tax=Ileibacterium valens TaxID=1862668 RepID=UPI00259BE146|nr:hypothetical protein [Ileibacterium valens]
MANKNEQLTQNLNTVAECNSAIQEINKKFKATMYAVMVCVVLYLLALFWLRNNGVVLIICIPMLIFAVMNNRYGKQIRVIAGKREQIRKEEARVNAETNSEGAEVVELQPGDITETITNAKSLNDLPKEYTVLDEVMINERPAAHIIVSPYGVVIVDNEDRTQEVRDLLENLNIEYPITWYEPVSEEQVFDLASKIQENRTTVLTEPEIYKILYRLNGLA